MDYLSIICEISTGAKLKEILSTGVDKKENEGFLEYHRYTESESFQDSVILIFKKSENQPIDVSLFGKEMRVDDIPDLQDDEELLFIYHIWAVIDSLVIYEDEEYVEEFMRETEYVDLFANFENLLKDAKKILQENEENYKPKHFRELSSYEECRKKINMITEWIPITSKDWESGNEETNGYKYAGLRRISPF